MINKKWLEKASMLLLEEYIAMFGNTDQTKITFYETFLQQTDKKVLQHLREQNLRVEYSLVDSEYLDLEKNRQIAVEEIRKLENNEGEEHGKNG